MLSTTALLVFTAACSHKAVAVNKPAAPATQTPPTSTPAATPLQNRTAPATTARNTTPSGPRQMTPQERNNLNQSLSRLEDAMFDYDKATIRPDAMKALQDDVAVIKSTLAKYPTEVVKIEGHCDERGSAEYNLALGDRRAAAAKEFLVGMGISANQLSPVSYGKEHQVCSDHTEACWQANRRAHLVASN